MSTSSPSLITVLSCGTAAAPTARSLVRTFLRGEGVPDDEALHDTALVVTELVANAVAHAGRAPLTVGAELEPSCVLLWVADASPVCPSQRTPEHDEEGGRGMLLVEHLSASWAVEPWGAGKRVRATVDLQPARMSA